MINIEEIEVGVFIELVAHNTQVEVIDYSPNKTIIWVEDEDDHNIRGYSVKKLSSEGWTVCGDENKWVDCPTKDISFATSDRIECRARDSRHDAWEYQTLIAVLEDWVDGGSYPFFTKNNRYMYCEIKPRDLAKFD